MDRKEEQGKWAVGHGGINCPCCLPGSKKETKKGAARNARRVGKLAIKAGKEER